MSANDAKEAVILAGGRSQRMGREKALLPVGARPLVVHAADVLKSAGFDRLWVSVAHDGPSPALEEACREVVERGTRLDFLADRRPGNAGPLAGVEAGLRAIAGGVALFVAVDLPHLDATLLKALWSAAAAGRAGVVPRWSGGLEPACAAYGQDLLPTIEGLLEKGERRLLALAEQPEVCWLEIGASLEDARHGGERLAFRGALEPARAFRNLNTPEDYRQMRP